MLERDLKIHLVYHRNQLFNEQQINLKKKEEKDNKKERQTKEEGKKERKKD